MAVTFSEIAILLYPYCGQGQNYSDFVVELIDNIMEEPADGDVNGEYNPLRGLVARTLENYYNGSRPISRQNASKILRHLDRSRFELYINELPDDVSVSLAAALEEKGVNATAFDISITCAALMEVAIRSCSNVKATAKKDASPLESSNEPASDTNNSRYKPLKAITPPDEVAELEIPYVSELMAAYGDAEGVDDFSKETMKQYPAKYGEHFKRQRKDFYAAESVRQGTRETYGDTDPDQFEVLKEETYDGIIDVWEQDHVNGFIRLSKVLIQAAQIQIGRCWLCRDTDWIGINQKKGVCHILVNDGKIKGWVNTGE